MTHQGDFPGGARLDVRKDDPPCATRGLGARGTDSGRCALLSLIVCGAACGSSSSSSGALSLSVSGTVGGQAVALNDAASVSGPLTVSGTTVYESDVFITNVAGACTSLEDNANPANGALLGIAVAGIAAVGTGMYAVTSTGGTRVTYEAQDANCTQTVNENAVSGTVTYTTVNSSVIAGSFDATFASGDHLTGTFSAPICNANLDTILNQSGTTTACTHDGG
ncbi:MAG: hypothetical protein ACLP1X_03855 [Polyangiaceae bacterium]